MDLIWKVPYRIDLDVDNGTMLKLSYNPQISQPIGAPPEGLDSPWDNLKEARMLL